MDKQKAPLRKGLLQQFESLEKELQGEISC
jgi:hypothetical protein